MGKVGALQHWRRGLIGAVQSWANGSMENVIMLIMHLIEHFNMRISCFQQQHQRGEIDHGAEE